MKAKFQVTQFRKRFIGFFLIVVVLFSVLSAGSVAQVQAQQPGSASLSGWFTIIRGDRRDGSLAREIYTLTTDDGQSVPLALEPSAISSVGGLLAIDRKHITVNGDWSQGLSAQSGVETFQVSSINPSQELDAASLAVTGPQKWISIMCMFKGNASQPATLSYFQNMYMNSQPGLDHYWRQVSYNLINTLGSTATGWYQLPRTHDQYIQPDGWFNTNQAAADCTAAADASVNFSSYVGINLMFNDVLEGQDCCAWGGTHWMTLDGVEKNWNMTWEPPWGWENIAVLGHEMGHALGLPHSSGNYGETYDNEWDVMSDTWTGCYNRGGADAVYGCMGQHTIAYHKDSLGWIPAAQKYTPAWGTTKNLVLEQLALPQTSFYKMVQIPIGGSATHFYTVEARRLTGYDFSLPGNAVIIHEVDTTREEPAHVVDIDNNTVTGDTGAMWLPGEVFRDNANQISVAVFGSTATGFSVNVTLGLNIYYVNGNAGVSNATISYTGGSTTTDSSGNYGFPVPAGWSGTVVPSRAGFVFSPANRTYTNVVSDKLAQNYTGAQLFSISGSIGVAGATLSYTYGSPKAVTSNASGNYALSVPSGWTGVVTPSHPCFTFTPANRSYSSLAGNQTSQNFTPTLKSGAGCADVRTWIASVERGRFGLPSGDSTRASFTGVSGGAVEILSLNGLPIIAAERVVYKVNGSNTSYTEMMGLPHTELDTTYWLPWYNNVELDTQLRFGNANNATVTVQVYVGGVEMSGSPFTIGPFGSTRKSFPGVNGGPVKIVSSATIAASERVIYKVNGVDTSLTEMMALPNAQLDNTYWLPWYNNVDLDTQLRFANVSESQATVRVYVGGAEMTGSPFTLQAGESTRKSFAGINNGPVQIVSTQNIVVAERVIYKVNGVNTSFSEMMGMPGSQLDTTYWLPWYNNTDLDTQLRIANVSGSPATVHVLIGGVEMTGSPFTLQVGESTRKSFFGVNDGPVKIVSNQAIVAAERLVYKAPGGVNTSFSEMMALPNSQLYSIYWMPYYNNLELDTQLRFATP